MSLPNRLLSLRVVYLALISLVLVLAACTAAPSGTGNQGGNEGNDGNGAATDDAGDNGGDDGGDGDSGGDSGNGDGDVCQLVTQDEVQDAIDMVVDDWDVAEGSDLGGSCNFEVTGDEERGELGSVDIRLTENFPRESYDIVVESFDGEEVEGLGETAYWAEDVMNLGILLSGDRYLEVQIVILQSEDGHREAAIQLAEQALEGL